VRPLKAIMVVGIGEVSLEEFEAMLAGWINAGAPQPLLEGTREEQAAVLRRVAVRADAQMRAIVESMLNEL
jgi:hypothetical protein